MVYKVGDLVLIRNNLIIGVRYDGLRFTQDMSHMSGKIGSIIAVDSWDDTFAVKGCSGYWWNDAMVSKVITNEK
jgi:hypothetical protein